MLYVCSNPKSLQRHHPADCRISGPKMADEDMPSARTQCRAFDLAAGHNLARHWGDLCRVSLSCTMAYSKQQRWMGRLDHPFCLRPTDTIHNPHRDQSVVTTNFIASSIDHADFTLLVAHNGMGKDIWNVPFEDITMMLKVSRSRCFA
jgi:hypothetical protein